MEGHPDEVFNGDVKTVMTRVLKQCSEAMMEAWDMVDAEDTDEERSFVECYRIVAKMHDPLCVCLSKMKEAAYAFTMTNPGVGNPLAGIDEKVSEELVEAFSRIMEEE